MANDFKALIGIAYDLKQAQSELDRQIKSLQKSTKLALDIELSDKEAKKVIQDSTKMWSNYRKEAVAAMTAPNTELKKMGQHYKNLEKNIIANNKLNDSIEITKIRAEGANKALSSYVKTLKPDALKLYSDRINEISDAFTKAQETGDRTDYNKATSSLSRFKSEMKDAGMETATLTQKLKENIGAFSQWYFIGNAVGSLVRNFKASINTIKEVDTFLTEISKTSEISAENLKKLGIDAFDYASKYGSTVQAYLSGVQEMSRAGYDEFVAKGLAELSILAQSAGDMTAELANEYLIATNAAYKYDGNVKKLNDVLDSQNQVTNRNAITMSKLAEATKIAGSQAASSGVEVDELTAAITTMGVVTQAEGNTLGRAFKGILMNLQQVSGEIDGEIIDEESFTKVEKAADALGVKLKETRDGVLALRDPMQILKELAEEYSKLAEGDVRGANLISSLGGKYRGNQLVALLDNWEIYEKVLNDYKNASGSAAEEAQKTADSLEGRLNKLTNTWNRTVANVVDSDLIKAFVSTGTSAVDLIDKLDLLQTTLIGLGGFATYKGLTSLIPMLKNAVTSTLAFGNALNTVKNANGSEYYTTLTNAIRGLSVSQAATVLSTQKLSKAEVAATMINAGFSAEQATTTASTMALASAQGVATGTTLTLSGAIKSLWAVIAANPIGAVITALTIGYSAFSFISNKVKQDREELLATSKQITDEYKHESQAIDEQIKKYKELSEQLSNSNNSYDDTKNIKDQLYTIQTNLIDSYGLEAEGLDLVNGKYQEQVDILNNLSKQKAKDYLAENKASFENAKDALNKERTYKLGKLYQGDNKGLINYLKEYDSSFLKLKQVDYGTINQEIKIVANVDDADRELHRLYNDIEQYGKDTGEDVNSVLITISEQLNKTWTDELKTHKDNYDTYVEAEIIYHDTLGQLYLQSKQVVNDYNKALASGEGIEEAKNNLDELKNKVAQSTKEVEGSQKVFDDIFSKITTGVQNVNSKINDKSGIQSLFTEAQNKAIDEYQKSISSIGKALSDLNKLSPTEIIDLMQEFPDLAKYGYTGSEGIDALKLALEKVGTQLYNNLDPSIENVELFKQMYKEAMDASNSVFTLAESLSAMSSSGKQVENLTSEFEELGYISTDTLNSLIDKYPQLEQAVADYVSGKITEKELIAEMSKVYQTDYENYREFVIKKKELDEGFYKDAVANLPFWIKDLADSYDIDFGNFKNLQESKLKVAEEYQNKLNEIQELDRRYKAKTLFDPLGIKKDAIGWLYDDAKSKLEKEAEDYKKILDGIDLSLNTTLDIDGYKPSGLPKDKKDKIDPIKEAFDKKKAEIDHLLAMDKITQQDYLNRLEKLNNEYFGKNKAKYLDQYRKYVEEVYKGRKKIDEDEIKNAFNLGTTDSKGNKILGKNDLDYKLAMEEITQEEYLKGLEKINKATFGKHKDKYLEDYRKNEIEIDKGRKAIDKKIAEELVKSKFSDVDHDYAMGRIKTEKEYQTARWELAKEYYKNNKDYLNEWKKAQEEWHKWNIEQTEKELKETEKKRLNTIDKIISKYGELRDAINKTAEYQSGDEQVSTYLEGIKSANKEIKYIENEIKKLNKKKITSLFTQDDYDSQLKTLQSALSKARSSIEDFNKSIADSIKSSSKDVMDALEDDFKKMTEYWENEKNAYSDIIKAQKDILNLKKEQNEYEKSIAKKTKEISKIESRMAELQKAASTGDRQANAELQKLNEELADKKEDLSDTQADHEHDLANKALDKALDDNNKIVDAKLKAIKTEYETQRDNQQKLYDQLIELTSRASNYSIEAYSKAIDEIASKMAQNGIGLNADHITSLKNAQAQSYNNANSVYSILGNKSNANMSQDTSGLSGLNKYLASQGYSIVNKNKMVQLAQALGLYDINNPNMVGTDELGRLNKNRIMEALKRMFSGSTFAKGGIASLPKMLGEDGIAFVKNGEPILTVEQGKLFKELVNNIKPLNNLVKLSTPNMSNIINNSSPTVKIDSLITVTGNVDSSVVPKIQSAGDDVIKKLVDIIKTK